MSKNPFIEFADFRKIITGRFFATCAIQIQSVLIGWHIYMLTKDPLMLGVMGLVEAIPAISTALFSGVIIDHNRPVKIILRALMTLFISTLMLALSLTYVKDLSLQLIALYLALAISGVARMFVSPSAFALISTIIPKEKQSGASAWNMSSTHFGFIMGPLIAGISYATISAVPSFYLPPITLVISIIFFMLLSSSAKLIQAPKRAESVIEGVKRGVDYVWNHPVFLSVMGLDMLSVFFGGVTAILPMISDQILHSGPEVVGMLRSSLAVGSVLTGLYLAFFPLKVIRGKTLLIVIALFGVCNFLIPFSTSIYMTALLLFLSGIFDGVNMVIRGAIFQILTPDDMRGRVSAINSAFITSSNELGAFESGTAAKILGLIPSIYFGGAMTIFTVLLIDKKVPDLRKLEIRH